MSKIPAIAMLPIKSRYTAEWLELLQSSDEFAPVLSHPFMNMTDSPYNYFSNLEAAAWYEMEQIQTLLYKDTPIEKVFLLDLDFPGLTAAAMPLLQLKHKGLRLYAILHAGSYIRGDLFESISYKRGQEAAAVKACKIVFVASEYHRQRLEAGLGQLFPNVVVLHGLPFIAANVRELASGVEKSAGIIALGRKQQIDLTHLASLECEYHQKQLPRAEFVRLLAQHKVVVIPKVDDTFGLSALEAIAVGTIPIVPRGLAYDEFLPLACLYSNPRDLQIKVEAALANHEQLTTRLQNSINFAHFEGLFHQIAERIIND